MDAITKIIEQIDQAAATKRTAYKSEQLAQIDADFLQRKMMIEAEDEKLTAQLQKNQNIKYKQLHARQQMEVKQETLMAKQNYLSQVFAEAYSKMQAWQNEEIRDFAATCLEQLSLEKGKKVLFKPSHSMPKSSYSTEWLAHLNEKLDYELVYGGEIPADSYGFVIDDEGIQYNFLYQDLLNEIKTSNSSTISNMLFEI